MGGTEPEGAQSAGQTAAAGHGGSGVAMSPTSPGKNSVPVQLHL